jgi:hypothetical protein
MKTTAGRVIYGGGQNWLFCLWYRHLLSVLDNKIGGAGFFD